MALIKCPKCGGKLFERAVVCPHCGYQNRKIKLDWNAIIIAIIGLVGVLLGALLSSRYASEATIEAAKISVFDELDLSTDLGAAFYRERSIYEGKVGSHAVKVYPYADHNANNTLENYSTDQFTIDAAVVNVYKSTWYRLDKSIHPYPSSASGEAYIYSGDLVYVEDAAIIKWVGDNISERKIEQGNLPILEGIIVSTNQMSKITAEIYRGEYLVKGPVEIPLDNVYTFLISESILNASFFETLDVGADYRLELKIYYWSNGGKLLLSKNCVSNFQVI